jgi:glucose-6-phosphate isomerase
MLDRLDARQLGALIALWEHRVLCLAAMNNINPFDQWGVELGKRISREVLAELSNNCSDQRVVDRASSDLIQWVLKRTRDK